MTITIPQELTHGTVTGRFLIPYSDGADENVELDWFAAKGTALFTPSASSILDPINKLSFMPATIECNIDADGYLIGPDLGRGVRLLATNLPNVNPSNWTWRVDFRLTDQTDTPTRGIGSFSFELPAGETVDLTTVSPVPAGNGTYYSASGPKGDPGTAGTNGKSAYEIAILGGFEGTEQEWLDTLVGPFGPQGIQGPPGSSSGDSAYTVAVQNGFEGTEQEWLTSLNGDSAYDIAVTSEGFQGTKEQWLASLRGAQGPKGEPGDRGQIGFDGPVGPQGPGGKSLYQIYVDIENEYNRTPLELHEWFALQGRDAYMVYRDEEIRLGRIPLEKSAWLESLNGDNAYDIAKKWPHNFTGTEAQWLASLKGVKGDKGDKGDTGTPALIRTGTTTVVDNVNFASVTITDPDINGYQSVNFAIPRGPKGDIGDPSTVPGPEGKSAFQSWYESYPEGEAPYDSELMWTISVLENDYTFAKDRMGFTGTREDWIESLQGPPGPTGASGGNSQATNLILNGAFDIWQRGTSFTVAANGSAYTADRWRVSGTNSSTVTKIASANINEYNTPNWLKVEAPAATVGKYVELETTIESADAQIFYGQSITYSFDYVSIGANGGNDAMFDLFIEVPNSKDNWTTVGARTKITDFYAWAGNVAGEYGRIYLPAGADKGFKLIFKLKHSNNQQNINFQIGKIQLEVTPVDQTTGDFLQEPSAFRRKGITIAGELAECQRYYQRVSRSAANVMYVHGLQATGTTAYVSMPLAVPMFKVPTCGYSGVRWKNSVDERALTSMPVKAGSDNKIVEITPTWATTSAAAFTPGMLQSTTTTSYVEFTAEI